MSDEPKNKKVQPWWQPALELFSVLAMWLVFPILLAIGVGKWLDKNTGHDQMYYYICVAVAFVITMAGLIRYAVKMVKRMDEISGNQKSQIVNPKSEEEENKIEGK